MGGPDPLATMILGDSIWQVVYHNWALTSILATLLVLIVVPALVVAKYVRIVLNILQDSEPPLFRSQFGFIPLAGEEVDFYAADGVHIHGTMAKGAAETSRGLVIFAPEFKSDRLSCARYCRSLVEAGYDVFAFDFRGHGESASEEGHTPRQWASDREVADMTGAIAYAEQWLEQRGRPIEIGLFGISRGGSAAILTAESCSSVKAIVTDGAFSSDLTLEHFMKRWAKIFAKVRFVYENHPPEFWRFLRWCLFVTCRIKYKCVYPSARKALTRMVPRPILFIHGERDSYIPVETSRKLYALSAQPRYLWIVPKAKHNQCVEIAPEQYARHTVHFFDKYLANRQDPENMYNGGRFGEIVRSEQPRKRLESDRQAPAAPVRSERGAFVAAIEDELDASNN